VNSEELKIKKMKSQRLITDSWFEAAVGLHKRSVAGGTTKYTSTLRAWRLGERKKC